MDCLYSYLIDIKFFQCPTAHVALTHDEQWMNFRNEGNSNAESVRPVLLAT